MELLKHVKGTQKELLARVTKKEKKIIERAPVCISITGHHPLRGECPTGELGEIGQTAERDRNRNFTTRIK